MWPAGPFVKLHKECKAEFFQQAAQHAAGKIADAHHKHSEVALGAHFGRGGLPSLADIILQLLSLTPALLGLVRSVILGLS